MFSEEVEMIECPAWMLSGEGISLGDAESGVALMLKNGHSHASCT